MDSINKQSFGTKLKVYKRRPLSLALFLLVIVSTILTVGILLF